MVEFTVAARLVHFAAVALLFGASLFRLFVAGAPASACNGFDCWLRKVLLAAAVSAFVSALAWWDSVAAGMDSEWSHAFDGKILAAVLFDTQFGRVWSWRILTIGVVVAILVFRNWPTRTAASTALAGLAAIPLASLALVGHGTMDHDSGSGTAHGVADAVHLLCAGAWLGGLPPLAYVLNRACRDSDWLSLVRHTLPKFSRLGYGAVGLLLLTGIANAIFISVPMGLPTTEYGYLLVAKLCLFAIMAAFATHNRIRLAPRVLTFGCEPAEIAVLARMCIVELSLGIVVLGIVSLLGTLPPPHGH